MPKTKLGETLKLGNLLKLLDAAEQKSSAVWVCSTRQGTPQVYSPSLGIPRRIVEVAEPYSKDFGAYIAACCPGNIRKLINIAAAAHRIVDFHKQAVGVLTTEEFEARIEKSKELVRFLASSFEGVEF